MSASASRPRSVAVAAVRSTPVWRAGAALSARSLRVLAYHDVGDNSHLDRQLAWLSREFTPVTAGDVRAAARGAPLPRRAVWVTFDDGCPGVVDNGQPVLDAHGITATMYICPGLVDADEPFWWDTVLSTPVERLQELLDAPVADANAAVERLKAMPDVERRALVAVLPRPAASGRRQLDDAQLARWLSGGHELGNHTWDHPCLDRCDEAEQLRQVHDADRWLRSRVPGWEPTFAYPNGNWSAATDAILDDLGYRSAVLHDHRLADPRRSPRRLSRLHVDADDSLERFRSIVAGVQPALRRLAGVIPRR